MTPEQSDYRAGKPTVDVLRYSAGVMTSYRGRRAATIENDALRVTVLEEGGHIAEIADKATGVNPLWTPGWPSIEPSTYDPRRARDLRRRRRRAAARRHHGPQPLSRHLRRAVRRGGARRPARPRRSLDRALRDRTDGRVADDARAPAAGAAAVRAADRSRSTAPSASAKQVENLSATDRPVGWTAARHARSAVPGARPHGVPRLGDAIEGLRGDVRTGRLPRAAAPSSTGRTRRAPAGGTHDLRRFPGGIAVERLHRAADGSGARARLLRRLRAGVAASRSATSGAAPTSRGWASGRRTGRGRRRRGTGGRVTRGMEFGVSPFPETRRQMIERGPLFGTPTVPLDSGARPGRRRILGHPADRRPPSRNDSNGRLTRCVANE